ncbi:transcriptional regulator BolA [Anaplasma phagocytophilum]|uniref:BolA family protein n=1 Tax=Anaplasma phagocytophilum TaxID=948 RepID=UPI0007DF61D8|nr:transcriptional regulator BolA [Anaplasma phagocytophilum]SCV63865.1 transcriptional regulator BolA [Anaplasma phagocytophilum]
MNSNRRLTGSAVSGKTLTSKDRTNAYLQIAAAIECKILDKLGNASVEIVNESDNHIGHLGSAGYTVSHLRVTVISDYFSGMTRLERHRLLHQILEDEIKTLHSITFLLQTNSELSH